MLRDSVIDISLVSCPNGCRHVDAPHSAPAPYSMHNDRTTSEEESGGRHRVALNLMPETYEDAKSLAASANVAAETASVKAGLQPSPMVAVSVSAVCSMARVVLINDHEGQGVPVLSFASREVSAQKCTWRVFPFLGQEGVSLCIRYELWVPEKEKIQAIAPTLKAMDLARPVGNIWGFLFYLLLLVREFHSVRWPNLAILSSKVPPKYFQVPSSFMWCSCSSMKKEESVWSAW